MIVERSEAVGRASVRRRIHEPRRNGDLLGVLLHLRRLRDCVMADRCQSSMGVSAEPNVLQGRAAVADEREHLLTRERELDRPLGKHLRSHRRDDEISRRVDLRAEAAADMR
jgi:hypothetical protein